MRELLCGTVFLLLLTLSGSANAVQFITGHVVEIESSYMPLAIRFTLDEGNSSCPAGVALTWNKDTPGNTNAVLATLLSAFASGKRIKFIMEDNEKSCVGSYIYIVN